MTNHILESITTFQLAILFTSWVKLYWEKADLKKNHDEMVINLGLIIKK